MLCSWFDMAFSPERSRRITTNGINMLPFVLSLSKDLFSVFLKLEFLRAQKSLRHSFDQQFQLAATLRCRHHHHHLPAMQSEV